MLKGKGQKGCGKRRKRKGRKWRGGGVGQAGKARAKPISERVHNIYSYWYLKRRKIYNERHVCDNMPIRPFFFRPSSCPPCFFFFLRQGRWLEKDERGSGLKGRVSWGRNIQSKIDYKRLRELHICKLKEIILKVILKYYLIYKFN